jgi:DNA invertase Pin-like site-specific DNA recombinase
MKGVIYARQSSGDEEQSASVEQQIVNCQKLAFENGIEIVGVYQDLNISGKTYPDTTEAAALAAVDEAYKAWVKSTYDKSQRYRKGLAEVISVLKSVNYVLVDDFTRLMRPLPASYLESHIIQHFKMTGVKIHCVKGGIVNMSSFTDNLVATIVSQINANQIEIQREKSIGALRKLKDEGYRATGSNFTGYRNIGYQTYEIVPEEAKIVKKAYQLGIDYVSYQGICRILCREFGLSSLSYSFLKGVYKRPEYAGYQYNSKGKLIPSQCFKDIPIITLSEFLRMQERFNNKRVHNHDRKEVYAFTGLCFCGYCGRRMQVTTAEPFPGSKEGNYKRHFFSCVHNSYSPEYKNN